MGCIYFVRKPAFLNENTLLFAILLLPFFFRHNTQQLKFPVLLYSMMLYMRSNLIFLSLPTGILSESQAYDDAYDTSTFIPSLTMVDGIFLDSTGVQLRGHSSYDYYPE